MTNALSVFSWITLGLWVILIAYIARNASIANSAIEHRQRASVPARILKIVAMLYLFALLYVPHWVGVRTDPGFPNPWLGAAGVLLCAAGVLLCAAGVGLVMASRSFLGRNWSDLVVLKQDHKLIQSGPYRWVRHPLYSGMLLAILGSAVTVNHPAAYVAIPCILAGFWIKSRQEEKLLQTRFPEYGDYRRHVKAFIPFVL
jgi:protein-S-isoprenylcysteine O-methyltransferase Ste14